MKYLVLIFIFIVSTKSMVIAQEFSLEDFINSAYNDPLVINIHDQSDYLRSADLRTPNINEVEIRTRSEDMNLSIDDVRFRLTLTNFGESREGNRYNDLLIDSYTLEYNVRLHLALVHRYDLAIRHMNLYSELQLVQNQKLNVEDRITVEKSNLLYGRGSVSDLTKLESDYTSLIVQESDLKNKLTILESQMLNYYSFVGPVTISMDSIINTASIKSIVELEPDGTHPEMALKEQEIQLGLQETELGIKEGNGDFGYFQAEYERNRGNTTVDNFGYQLGFNIPITNPDKAKIEKSKLKNLKNQQSFDNSLQKHEQEISILKRELNELIDQYDILETRYSLMVDRNKSLTGSYMQINSVLIMQENELRLKKSLIVSD